MVELLLDVLKLEESCMVRKEAIREKILDLGADVCGFGGVERFLKGFFELNQDCYTDILMQM